MAESNTSSGGNYGYVYVYDNFDWYVDAFNAFGDIFWKDEYFDWASVLRNMNLTVQVNDLGYREQDMDAAYEYHHRSVYIQLVTLIWRLYISYDVESTMTNIFGQSAPLFTLVVSFGIASNVINLIVFKRQGIFKDSCTVTLTALTITDFLSSFISFVTSLGINVTSIVFEINKDTPLTSGRNWMTYRLIFMNIFGQISRAIQTLIVFQVIGWVTSYLALERMVSVTFPFKVKALVTPKRSCAIITGTILLTIFIQIPRLANFGILWKHVKELNGTLVPSIANPERVPHDIVNALTFLNKFGISSLHVIVLSACNIIVAIKVNSSQRFRKSALSSKADNTPKTKLTKKPKWTTSDTKDNNSKNVDQKTKKELRLIRVMYAMSFTFLLTRIPDTLMIILQQIFLNISSERFMFYMKATQVFFSLVETTGHFLVNLNGATNMLIYVSLSQNYRKIFLELFSCSSAKKRT